MRDRDSSSRRNPDERERRSRFGWIAGILGGVAAGIIATLVQLALWWVCAVPLPETLFRDARLAAAVVMGSTVLPPPASFDWTVMMVATVVHFALSMIYGLALMPLAAIPGQYRAMAAGAAAGFLLFVVNMYGFTSLYPWFEVNRDWITAAAHIAFGITAVEFARKVGNRGMKRV